MKRTLLFALLVSPMFAMAQTAPSTQTATFDGTWQLTGDVSANPVVSTCILTTAEGKISGTCTGTDGKVMPATGTVAEGTAKWSYESVYDNGRIVLHYTGTLDKDGNITGSIFVDPYDADGTFTAKRQAAGSTPAAAPGN